MDEDGPACSAPQQKKLLEIELMLPPTPNLGPKKCVCLRGTTLHADRHRRRRNPNKKPPAKRARV